MRGPAADGNRLGVELEPITLSLWALQLDGGGVAVPGSVETSVSRDERLAAGRVLISHAQDSGAKGWIIDDRVRWTERGGGRSRFRVDSAVGGVRRRRHCLGKGRDRDRQLGARRAGVAGGRPNDDAQAAAAGGR